MEDDDAAHVGKVFVDTNVLVYLRQKQSPFHEAARERLSGLEKRGVEHILTHNVSDFERFEEYITVLPLVREE